MCTRLLVAILLNLLLLLAQAQEESPYEEDEEAEEVRHEALQDMRLEDRSDPASGIPGEPGVDYPTFKQIPPTLFTCTGRLAPGYYADVETRCQVFHICGVGGAKHSFLCPVGSVFNQKYLVCDWWYKAACDEAVSIFTDQIEFRRLESEQDTGVFIPGNHQNYVFLTDDIFHTAETGVPGRDKAGHGQASQENDAQEHSEPRTEIKQQENHNTSDHKLEYGDGLSTDRTNQISHKGTLARKKQVVLRKVYPTTTLTNDFREEQI